MITDAARVAERDKYVRAYATGRYRIKPARLKDAIGDLTVLPSRGSLLDVSCGYGDLLTAAKRLRYRPCTGTEILDELCDGVRVVKAWAHALPFCDGAFDVVTMTDVIEHLLPGDDEAACRELRRVARRHVILTANNRPSRNHIGDDLHVNKRPYEEWDALFRAWLAPSRVTWLRNDRRDVGPNASAAWRIDL
jgi:ubiquinone/menaquinone biosynthesis C-methylase UbiE